MLIIYILLFLKFKFLRYCFFIDNSDLEGKEDLVIIIVCNL